MMPRIHPLKGSGSAGGARIAALLLVAVLGLQLHPITIPGRVVVEVSSDNDVSSFFESLNVCEEGDCFTGLSGHRLLLPESGFCFVQTSRGFALSVPLSRTLPDGHPPEVFKPPRLPKHIVTLAQDYFNALRGVSRRC